MAISSAINVQSGEPFQGRDRSRLRWSQRQQRAFRRHSRTVVSFRKGKHFNFGTLNPHCSSLHTSPHPIRRDTDSRTRSTVIHRNDYDIVPARQVRSVINSERTGTLGVPPAVQPHHHRPLACAYTSGPHVQTQAVLARRLSSVLSGYLRNQTRWALRRPGAELHSLPDARPRVRFRGRHKAPSIGSRGTVGKAEKCADFITRHTPYSPPVVRTTALCDEHPRSWAQAGRNAPRTKKLAVAAAP